MAINFSKHIGFSTCALCESSTDLKESHIIPSFVFRRMIETSATGFIRLGAAPNLRVQDGWKPRMLCGDCEERFSLLETRFADNCFYPIGNGDCIRVHYESWMLKFATSVSWRVLRSFKAIGALDDYPENVLEAVDHALSTWKKFLLGKEPHPGRHEQHLILLDGIESATLQNLPANINRYLIRAIDIHVAYTPDSAVTYAKLGKFLLFGFIKISHPRYWEGTKINAKKGWFGVRDLKLPENVGNLIMDRARLSSKMVKQTSEKQRGRIAETYSRDLDRTARSESMQAMDFDVLMFGKDAFGVDVGEDEEFT